jgi:hypothetical protein
MTPCLARRGPGVPLHPARLAGPQSGSALFLNRHDFSARLGLPPIRAERKY